MSSGGSAWRIDSHDAGADDNQENRGYQTRAQPTHRAAGGKTFPEQRQDDYWQIRRGRDGECQGDQKRNVRIRTEQDGDGDRYGADHESCDARDPYFFSRLALIAAVNDVRVEVIHRGNERQPGEEVRGDRESTRLDFSHVRISY